jgi:hypothetical protein
MEWRCSRRLPADAAVTTPGPHGSLKGTSPLQACYGSRELISGKREEKFPAYRYVVVPHNLTGSTAKVAAEPAAPAKSPGLDFGKATSILREKIAFLQKERAVVTSAEQKFELLFRIREAEQHLSELETDSSKT